MNTVEYLTDGSHLYEVTGRRTTQNHGLSRGVLRYVAVIDCANGEPDVLNERRLATCRSVIPTPDPPDPALAALEQQFVH